MLSFGKLHIEAIQEFTKRCKKVLAKMIFLTFLRIVILNQRFGNTGEYAYQSHGTDCIDHKFQRQEST